MAKRYRKQNGLFLADDSIALPKHRPPKPWYEGKLSPWRGMSRRKCCCGGETTCSECAGTDGNAPMHYEVVITGITGAECCSGWTADSYILTIASSCTWEYRFPTTPVVLPCLGGYEAAVLMSIIRQNSIFDIPVARNNYYAKIIVAYNDDNQVSFFYDFGADKPNCLTLENLNFTYYNGVEVQCSAPTSLTLLGPY
jgi:hypothetical protein